MSIWDHTQCPFCCTDNLPERDVCWQCGKTLPQATAPDGITRVRVDPADAKLTEADLQRLLAEAETYDMGTRRGRSWFGAKTESAHSQPQGDAADPHAGSTQHASGITWLRRLRRRQSQA